MYFVAAFIPLAVKTLLRMSDRSTLPRLSGIHCRCGFLVAARLFALDIEPFA